MRKSLLIVLAVMFVAAISSCTKKYVTPNNNYSIIFDVAPNQWALSSDGKSYTTRLVVDELDDYYNNQGGVLVYLSFGQGVYEQIPQVYDGVAYSYYHKRGEVVLYAQTPGATPVKPTENLAVKVVLIEANQR